MTKGEKFLFENFPDFLKIPELKKDVIVSKKIKPILKPRNLLDYIKHRKLLNYFEPPIRFNNLISLVDYRNLILNKKIMSGNLDYLILK